MTQAWKYRNTLRTNVLHGFNDRLGLWRSDATGYLYEWWRGYWRMFIGGEWVTCYDDKERRPFELPGKHGETFIRVGTKKGVSPSGAAVAA